MCVSTESSSQFLSWVIVPALSDQLALGEKYNEIKITLFTDFCNEGKQISHQ